MNKATRNSSSWLNDNRVAFLSVQLTNKMKSESIYSEGEAMWASMTSCQLISEILFNLFICCLHNTQGPELNPCCKYRTDSHNTRASARISVTHTFHIQEGELSVNCSSQMGICELTRNLARHIQTHSGDSWHTD